MQVHYSAADHFGEQHLASLNLSSGSPSGVGTSGREAGPSGLQYVAAYEVPSPGLLLCSGTQLAAASTTSWLRLACLLPGRA